MAHGTLSSALANGIIVSTGKAVDAADLAMKEGTVHTSVHMSVECVHTCAQDFPPTGPDGDDISLEFDFRVFQKTTVPCST